MHELWWSLPFPHLGLGRRRHHEYRRVVVYRGGRAAPKVGLLWVDQGDRSDRWFGGVYLRAFGWRVTVQRRYWHERPIWQRRGGAARA